MRKESTQAIYDNLVKNGLSAKYGKPGIYSISIEDKLVYIGKSRKMLWRLAEHIDCINHYTKSNKYKILRDAKQKGYHIKFDVLYVSPEKIQPAINEDIGYIEGVLIRKYKPALNYQIPKEDDWRKFDINKSAQIITLDEILEQNFENYDF